VFAGLGQAELMAARYPAAAEWCAKVFDVLDSPDDDPATWSTARRVLGMVRSQLGRPDEAVRLCLEARDAAPTSYAVAFAAIYLGVALLDGGRFQEAADVTLDAVPLAQRAGLDASFGGYLDAVAAEALTRLGRGSEAEALLLRHGSDDVFPVGRLRVALAGALVAARGGLTDRAHALLAEADAQPGDELHRTFTEAATAEVHLILGEWDEALLAADRGWQAQDVGTLLWSARFAMFTACAAVEVALDQVARREDPDPATLLAGPRRHVEAVRREAAARPGATRGLDTAARLAHAEASLGRLVAPDPDAWAEVAGQWTELGDLWWAAVARLREAEASTLPGSAARAAAALREAHRLASAIGATPILADVEAMSRRTRISLDAPAAVALDPASTNRLGLTAREAEVLALVAAGRSNRQIGAELFVSEKTASVHVSNILRKLGVTSRVDAAEIAQRLGIA
jgi:DNA-binding CsgD family transcriptional regulator/tetratricopeptide (TPR) repeat protein